MLESRSCRSQVCATSPGVETRLDWIVRHGVYDGERQVRIAGAGTQDRPVAVIEIEP